MAFEHFIRPADTNQGKDAFQVDLFDLSDPSDQHKLNVHFQVGRVERVFTLDSQLVEYLRSANPRSKASDGELKAAFLRDHSIETLTRFGLWVFFPWSDRLIHTLPEPLFRELRTNRNRHKISAEEQERLHAATIGIVGLSAGMAVATCMVLEGVGSRFRIADFDTLGLSNLNRIHAGVFDIGIPKTVVAAGTMLEMNPFLEIEVYPDGITEENMEPFFGDGKALSRVAPFFTTSSAKLRRKPSRTCQPPNELDSC